MLFRLLTGFAHILFHMVLLLALVIALIQLPYVKNSLLDFAADKVSTDESRIEIGNVEGFVPFSFSLDEFRHYDKQGLWLEVEDIEFNFNLAKLIEQNVVIEAAGADKVRLLRSPDLPQNEQEPAADPAFPEKPDLPDKLVNFALEKIYVNELIIEEPVIGRRLGFKIDGLAKSGNEAKNIDAALTLTGLDESDIALALDADVDLESEEILLDLRGHERAGLLAFLAKNDEFSDTEFSLTGSGPLADWRADLDLTTGGLIDLNASASLLFEQWPELNLNINAKPDPALIGLEVNSLIDKAITLNAGFKATSATSFIVPELTLAGLPLALEATASGDIKSQDIQARLQAAIQTLAAFSSIAQTELAGQAALNADISGSMAAPAIALSFDVNDLKAQSLEIEDIQGEVNTDLSAENGPDGLKFATDITLDQVKLDGQALKPSDKVTIEVLAGMDDNKLASLDELKIVAGPLEVKADGKADLTRQTADANLSAVVANVDDLLSSLGLDEYQASGTVHLDAKVNAGSEFKNINADLALIGTSIANLPFNLDDVIGNTPALALKGSLRENKEAVLETLNLDTATVKMDGKAVLGLKEGDPIEGTINLNIDDLSPLEGVLSKTIAGKALVSLQAGGSLKAPQLALRSSMEELLYDQFSINQVGLQASTQGLPGALNGKIDLEIEERGETVNLLTGFSQTAEAIKISDLRLDTPAGFASADIKVDVENLLAEGNIEGSFQRLAALTPFIKQRLSGSLFFDADLDVKNNQQVVISALQVPRLDGDFGRLRDVEAAINVEDPQNNLKIKGDINAGSFSSGTLNINGLNLGISGDRSLLQANAVLAGSQNQHTFNLNTTTTLDVFGSRQTVQVTNLRGSVNNIPLTLNETLRAQIEGQNISLDGLDLSIGSGRINGAIDKGQRSAQGEINIVSLPLELAEAFGGPPLAGELGGAVNLSGPLSNPSIDINLDFANIRPNDPNYDQPRSIGGSLESSLGSGRLNADIALLNLGDNPLSATVSLPMGLSLEPFAVDLKDNAALDGNIKGLVDLTRIVELALLDGIVLTGELDTDISIGGSLNAPELTGESKLLEGYFAESNSGFIIRQMTGTIKAENGTLVLDGFDLRDGDGGKIFIDGVTDLSDLANPVFDIDITADDMRVMDGDFGSAYLTADLEIDGDAKGGDVKGKLVVEKASIAIPSGGGIEPADLGIIARGQEAPEADSSDDEDTEQAAGPVYNLDMVVEIPSRFFVRGRGLESEWGGSINIAGTSIEPELTGAINYRRGYLDFLDRRFLIDRGIISFSGIPIPEIDLETRAQGATVVAIVNVSGPATDLDFTLSSDPLVPTDEVLSDLLFKRDVSQITPAQAIRLAAAVKTLEGGGGTDPLSLLRDSVGLDTLDIGGDSADEASAKAGKYLADGVFLEVERGLASGSGKARVEFELTPSVKLNTEVTDDSQSSVGIEWSIDY